MVWQAKWTTYGFRFSCFALLMLGLEIHGCCSLNSEGSILLEFRAAVSYDPYSAFANWNIDDHDPCCWSGVHCIDGNVHELNLSGLSLGGILAPELGELTHLRSLVLSNNSFSGTIPKEFEKLTSLEVLDLRDNNLTGNIPSEIGQIQSLKHLLLCNNKIDGGIPLQLGKLNLLSELQFDENLTSAAATGISCVNRKFGRCMWQSSLELPKKADSFFVPIKEALVRYMYVLPLFKLGKSSLRSQADDCCDNIPSLLEPHLVQNVQSLANSARRKLVEQLYNLAAAPANFGHHPELIISLPSSQSSGSFPASLKRKNPAPSPISLPLQASSTSTPAKSTASAKKPAAEQAPSDNSYGNSTKYIVGTSGAAFVLIFAGAVLFVYRKQAAKTIAPWKTGISGELQRAFVTGVPKLNRSELEVACEDFSNIIDTLDACAVYKGTLSSGVEIAVVSTAVASLSSWSKRSEMAFREKIDTLSRVNHKNFVNLIGYCIEDEIFTRIMVFEYAPNGTLFEHLHVEEMEHLDWSARMRIIMGTAYCLQHLHELNPPVAHTNLNSSSIFLTDDYAAKVAEIHFWSEYMTKPVVSGELGQENSKLPLLANPETNIYSFGILMLEIISGKVPCTEEQGNLENWAALYLNEQRSFNFMIDSTLKSFNKVELDIVCEAIRDCLQQDAKLRPTMRQITSKLREVIDISPDSAVPRLSPLWWAELEILSAEAT